jgi:putative ABC transport system ATP-binding protein
MAALLSGRALVRRFGERAALDGIDFDVARGEVVAVMGPSGSGKSTLLMCLAGIDTPDSGDVEFDGQPVSTMNERKRAELRLRRFGFVFQFGELVPELTLAENVSLPLWLAGTPRRQATALARRMLEELGVLEHADQRTSEVSGGEAQRAAVARALVHRPDIVFADEPTGALDTANGELALEALVSAAASRDAAVIIVTHEPRVAAFAQREVWLRDGRLHAPAALLP